MMFAIHGDWVHFARASQEWWFRRSDIAAIHTKGEAGKPIAFPDQYDQWFGVVYLKGLSVAEDYNSGILLYKDEFEAMRRVLEIK